jgi:DNA ligase D-like protein (predicted 3'-phosphoesterase)
MLRAGHELTEGNLTMALKEYRRKRDFQRTPEPRGKSTTKPKANQLYFIQKHDASHLHYDFRLEHDGVLKSWAVPKGPDLDPAVKRLAMQVEDHPLEYGDFEGTIPEGEYGAGTVMLWDKGTWEPLGDPNTGFREGHLKFVLHGEKLNGGWMLVRKGGKNAAEDERAWFLFKERDEFARPGQSITEEMPLSVKTGRDLDEIATHSDQIWGPRGATTRHVTKTSKKRSPRTKLSGRKEGRAKTAARTTTKRRATAKATSAAHASEGNGDGQWSPEQLLGQEARQPPSQARYHEGLGFPFKESRMPSSNSGTHHGMALGLALALSALAWLAPPPYACGQDATPKTSQAKGKWVSLFERHASEYVIRLGRDPNDLAVKLTEPVLRWWQPVRGGDDGALYIWVQAGRPVAAVTFFTFKWPNGTRSIVHEKASLATVPVEAVWRGTSV